MGRRGKGGKQNSATLVKTKPTTPANPTVISQMMQAYNTSYGPNAPLLPYPGLQPQSGPRQFAYPIATNLNLVTRDNLTPFQVLRQLSELYDGIRICQQSWFDCAAGLEPDIVPVPGLLGKNETADKYADDIAGYIDFFESPDRHHSIHEWLNAALDDLTTIDAVAMYPRLTYAGDLYSLDLVDGSTIKPLLDDRGRTPEPPFYAYEQVVYGAPSELFTSDELLYLKEHNRTHSAFGFSRVENILMRVNQALRKQSLDMAMFTDGNIPAGFVSPAADLGWTPDQLQAFQTILDSLYAGNDALRSRLKMMPPGSEFTPTNPISVETAFDLFLFTVTSASFGTNPAEAGFTGDVNRSSGETQADVLYRRTMKPIAMRFARLFNYILKKYFNERRFLFKWKGYEAADDFGASVAAHTQLVGAGIESATDAAEALKLPPQGPRVPRFIMTTSGPFVVDDLANKQLQTMKQQAQIAGLQMATAPKDDNGSSSSSQVASDEQGGESEEEPESSPSKAGKQDDDENDDSSDKEVVRLARADLRKWRDMAVSRISAGKPLRPFVSDAIPQGLFQRMERALTDCATVDEVKMIFASVQDHQFVRSAPDYQDTLDWQRKDPDIQARLQARLAQGVEEHTWQTLLGPCDACALNDGVTVKVGEPFPSGALMEPGHGNCNCKTVPVMTKKESNG